MIERAVGAVLLDIEGTTSSIAFVYDVMFPFIRQHVQGFLETSGRRTDVQSAIEQMAHDAGFANAAAWFSEAGIDGEGTPTKAWSFIAGQVHALMDQDSKSTGLKGLQGLIWESGFRSGELQSHLFPDVVPALERWKQNGMALGVYSSGSVVAQKLFFRHTPHGDLTPFFARHYDTTVGTKRSAESYRRIAEDFGFHPERILFLTDVSAEIDAALAAGLQALAVVRPGNGPLPADYTGPRIESFAELSLMSG